ncbi:MAG: metalloregulator ArsR/SmtB family transcription factor [Firmicutes bacterium]|nr:metalloregulator ArsR/SmtB family transcription factor [Bacillota bacterium]
MDIKHIRGSLPSKEELDQAAELFKACADATRVGILCALLRSELCVCDIAEILGMTSSAISHQLRSLKQLRIVKTRREGRSIYYSLADEHVAQIFQTAFAHIREGDI